MNNMKGKKAMCATTALGLLLSIGIWATADMTST
jgi:hypothetical protein